MPGRAKRRAEAKDARARGSRDERSQLREGLRREGARVKPERPGRERSDSPAPDETMSHPARASLWERFLSRDNLARGLRRGERNAGAAGIDGMCTDELRRRLHLHWPDGRARLDGGSCRPQCGRRGSGPNPSGGQRGEEGRRQGSPLSPLLGNVMLEDLDCELGRRGHRFVRYADDLMVYVGSERAAQRVIEGITQYVERRLKLRLNRKKSAVDRATKRPFLGFGFFYRDGQVKVRVDPKARTRAKERLRKLTSRRWGVSMERRVRELNRFTVGWTAYFASAVEGVEALPNPAAQPARARDPRTSSPRMGRLAQGLLAHRRLRCPQPRP